MLLTVGINDVDNVGLGHGLLAAHQDVYWVMGALEGTHALD